MNLNEALSDIARIRSQLDRAESYRGFRSLTVGLSAVFVVIGCVVQQTLMSSAAANPILFVRLWTVVACLAAITCTSEMLIRNRTSRNTLASRMHGSLIVKALPSLLVGAVVTVAISEMLAKHTSAVTLLPGMWAMLYGLGLWSCGANLPQKAHLATLYFLIVGGGLMWHSAWAQQPVAFQMAWLFGVGQTMLGLLLHPGTEQPEHE